jgi:hypothetical protein
VSPRPEISGRRCSQRGLADKAGHSVTNLMSDHKDATDWADTVIAANKPKGTYGRFARGVAWTEDGGPVAGLDKEFVPEKLVTEINRYGQPLLNSHDPGKPQGKLIAAKLFRAPSGARFIGVVLGYYLDGDIPTFSDFEFDFLANPGAPDTLRELDDSDYIEVGTDFREVDKAWVVAVAGEAPIEVRKRGLSHNAAEPLVELVRVSLPYVALVWNPFITAIASEAGKDTYKAMKGWLARLFTKVSELKKPILVLRGWLGDCDVSFIVRGNDVNMLVAARDGLETAASQAHHLVSALREQNAPIGSLVYEFDSEKKAWLPSFGVLRDGRLITDRRALILAENLPQGLSLGLGGQIDDD